MDFVPPMVFGRFALGDFTDWLCACGAALALERVSALGAGVGRMRAVGFDAVFKEVPYNLQGIWSEFEKHLSVIGASLCVFGAFHFLEFLIKFKDGSVAGGLVRASDILGHGIFSRGFVLCDVYGNVHVTAAPIAIGSAFRSFLRNRVLRIAMTA